jgi:chromosome segregation ATPase
MKQNIRLIAGAILFASGTLLISACGPSEKELAALEAKKQEVKQLELQANGLKDERVRLEKEIADKNKKIDDCSKVKQEVKANLEKVKK